MINPLVISLVNFLILNQLIISTVADSSPTQACLDGDKLCFGYPADCPTSSTFNCDILVLISAKSDSSGLGVDVYGSGSPGSYYALGFVDQPGMTGATVVHCDYKANSIVDVGESYTSGYRLIDLPPGTLAKDKSGNLENGIAHCTWTQKSRGTAGSSGIEYDINRPYFVQIAYGNILDGVLKHHTRRAITDATVNLTSLGVIKSSKTLPLAIRVHGSLMTIAWLCLVSIAMIIARYHKSSWGNTEMCGVKVWFALHRGLMLSAISSAVVGMVTIFVQAGGWRANTPHQYLGLSANILMVLQPLGALFRPAPDHENRIFFNILHTIGGNLGHTLAILTLFFVLKLSLTLAKAYCILLIIFVIVYLGTHMILQFHPHLLATLHVIESTDMNDLKGGTSSPNELSSDPVLETIERSKKRVLTLFIGLVIIITIALIIFINLGSP